MARQLPIAAAVLVFSIGLCASAFSQSPPTGQTHLPANCDGSPSANASARDVAALESDLARIARGDTDAMITLGYAYFAGQGLKRDVDCTIQLWQIAANAGNVGAMYALGSSYYGVVNFPTNYRLALEWSEKAAAGGKRHAAFLVAEIYDAGKGTEPDPNLAREWYERVWNWPGTPKDDHLAGLVTEALGRLYLNGRGVPQDDALAVQWWQRSADAGNRAAMGELARMYREGRGVKKSEQLAQFWSDRSAEENLPDCEASKLESNLSLHRNSKAAMW
jgi:TPR repeat protein